MFSKVKEVGCFLSGEGDLVAEPTSFDEEMQKHISPLQSYLATDKETPACLQPIPYGDTFW